MVKRLRMTAVKRDSAELNQILVRVLEENGVESWAYSLGGYRDERQCMEPDGENWVVYFGERGRKRRCKTFPTQKDAAMELLNRVSRTETQQAGLQASMERLWKTTKVVPAKDETLHFEAILEPYAATPVVLLPKDKEQQDMKVALLKARLAMLNRDSYRTAAAKTAAGRFAAKAISKKLKPKEKNAKTVKRIETFGFKG